MTRLRFASLLLTCACLSIRGQDFAGADNFSGPAKNTALWASDVHYGNGLLVQSGGRVFQTGTGTPLSDDLTFWPWKVNGPVNQNWTAQIDVNVPIPSSPFGTYAGYGQGFGFGLFTTKNGDTTGGTSLTVGLSAGFDTNDPSKRGFSSRYRYTATATDTGQRVATNSTFGSVRFRWDAATKTMYAEYDADGPAGGYQWSNVNVVSNPWNIADTDYFTVGIFGDSYGLNLSTNDNVFGDNFVAVAVSTNAPGDVSYYGVYKTRVLAQTNSESPDLVNPLGFTFTAVVKASANNAVTGATVQIPSGAVKSVPATSLTRLGLSEVFPTDAALNSAYGYGNYVITVNTVNDGTRNLPLNFDFASYPVAPRISNYAAAQAVNSATTFRLTWDALANGTALDFVQVSISDTNYNLFFVTGGLFDPDALNGTSTFADIPAYTLVSNATYIVKIGFFKVATTNTTTYPGASGFTAYASGTQLSLVTIGVAPSITSTGTATGTVGEPFTYQITASNNPTSFDATGLTAGLTVNTTSGLISGTPTASGTFTVTLSASNAGGTGTKTLTLTINPAAPVITSAGTVSGTVGQAFSYQITAANNPTNFNVTGLPAGLSVNTTSGLISGTPSASGTFTVTLYASNAGGTGTKTLTLTINPAAPSQPHYVEVGNLPVPTAGDRVELFEPRSATLFSFPTYYNGYLRDAYISHHGSNDTFSFAKIAGLDAPYWGRVATDGTNLYSTGGYASDAVRYVLLTSISNSPVWQSTTRIPGSVDTFKRALHQTVTFNGRLYIFGGWHGDQNTNFTDTYYAPIQSSGALGAFVQTTSLTVEMAAHSAVVSEGGTLYVVFKDQLYRAQIAANGDISAYHLDLSISGLENLNGGNCAATLLGNQIIIVDRLKTFICSLDGTGRVVSLLASFDNPAEFWGRYVYTHNGMVYVTARTGKVYRIDGLPFDNPLSPPSITSTGTVSGTVGQSFTYQITADNNPTSFNATGLPAGLTVNTTSGLISGTPTAPGIFTVTLSASNTGGTGTKTLTLTVNPAINRVLNFDGNGDLITVTSNPDLMPSDEITIEAWIYPLFNPSNQSPHFLSKGDGGSVSSSRSYELGLDLSGQFGSGMRVALSLFLGSDTWALHEAQIPYAGWTHVAGTYSSTRGLFQLLINGELAASTTNDASGTVPLLGKKLRQTTLPLVFGDYPPHSGTFATGSMDEIRIWNVARSQADILQTVRGQLSGTEPNLVAYWNFDDGTAVDLTGHGHNGTFSGNATAASIPGNDNVHAARMASITRQGNGAMQLLVTLATNVSHSVQFSTTLTNWVTLTNLVATNVPFQFLDATATNSDRGFYRVVSP